MNMKLVTVAAFFVVGLGINQVWASPYVTDGNQIGSVSKEDNIPEEEVLYYYAKLLAGMNQNAPLRVNHNTPSEMSHNAPPRVNHNAPRSTNEMAEDQTNALCSEDDCICDIKHKPVYVTLYSGSTATHTCKIISVPYCKGVCASTCGYKPVMQPTLKGRHEICKATGLRISSFSSVCTSIPGGSTSFKRLALDSIPTGCECIVP